MTGTCKSGMCYSKLNQLSVLAGLVPFFDATMYMYIDGKLQFQAMRAYYQLATPNWNDETATCNLHLSCGLLPLNFDYLCMESSSS